MAQSKPEQQPITITYEGSTLTEGQQEALDLYVQLIKQERVTPRQWLVAHPTVPCNDSFLDQLRCHYFLAFPPPAIPGFKILDVLGEGGMGQVYLALDTKLQREVAMKEITSRFRADKSFQERFRLEGIILAKLDHANIVRVHQFLEHASRDFICMEYVDQGSLADLLRPDKTLPVATAVPIAIKLAQAAQCAHSHKIIHRDLKPGNILFSSAGEPKITDFGLAKLLSDDGQASGMRVGTPAYMAPEQIRRQLASASCDIWALGVILYRMVNGYLPFSGNDQDELFHNILHEPAREFRADVPRDLQAVCLRCLAKDPGERFASAEELAGALEALTQSPAARTSKRSALFDKIPKTQGAVAAIVAMLAVLVIAVFASGVFSRSRPVKMLETHQGVCRSLAFLTDNLHAVSEDYGGELVQWDLVARRMSRKPVSHGLSKPDLELSGIVAVSPDGSRVVSAGINAANESMQILQVHDPSTLATTSTNLTFGALGRCVVFSGDGRYLAACELPWSVEKWTGAKFGGHALRIYDFESDSWLRSPLPWEIKSMAFSTDARHLVSCGGGNDITIWTLDKELQKQSFAAHVGGTDCVGYSSDGNHIYSLSAAEDALAIWSNDEQHRRLTTIAMNGMGGKMTCSAVAPNGLAITGHASGELIVWDLKLGKAVYRHHHVGQAITAVALSFNGDRGLVALADHTVWLHKFR